MEKIINQIVEIEMSARRIVSEAQENRDNLNATLKAELAEIQALHDNHTKLKLDIVKKEESKRLKELLDAAVTAKEEKLNILKQAKEENHDKWVDEIFSSIIKTEI